MLEDLQPPQKVLSCAVRTLRESLSETDQAILDKAILDISSWPHRTLAKSLTERGAKISDKPIRLHRLWLCSCPRGGEDA